MNSENMYMYDTIEECPHCEEEHLERDWFPEKGYRSVCCNCGESILLCYECLNAEDNIGRGCDWDNNTEKCFRDNPIYKAPLIEQAKLYKRLIEGGERGDKMKYTEREIKIFNAMINDYDLIDSDSALEKRGLEWSDYKSMGFHVDTLRYEKQTYVKSKRLADYFTSFGMTITNYNCEYRVQL